MEKVWQLPEAYPPDFAAGIPDLAPEMRQLLWNRGLREDAEIKRFLKPDLKIDAHDPFLFRQMGEAVDLAVRHIKAQDKITVFGDYDADGVTSSALMVETLGLLRADADIYIPHRVSEGYGLNREAVEKIASGGSKLIITVDNGIRGAKEVEYARSLGLDVIVTDHHPAPENRDDWPDCPVVNPVLPGEPYPFKRLSGAGVAFKFVSALIERSKLGESDKENLVNRVLDLVAIGTVADCVELRGENRALVAVGLKVLNETRRTGLLALIKTAGIGNGSPLDAWNIGFQIAPRLNAAGRLGSANTAYELLVTRDEAEAAELAAKLNERNVERQRQSDEIFAAVVAQIGPEPADKLLVGVCPDNQDADVDDWNEGVVGLVAGKVVGKYYLPALVITKSPDGYKGSGRSVPEFNLAAAVERCAELLTKFGGHPLACGFSLKAGNLDRFVSRIKSIAEAELSGADLRPKLSVETEMPLSRAGHDLALQTQALAPFGAGNDRPNFLSRGALVADIMNMGMTGQHLKLRLKSDDSGLVTAIGFGQSEAWSHLMVGDLIDIVYYLELNTFNGRTEPQLKIVDIKAAKEAV